MQKTRRRKRIKSCGGGKGGGGGGRVRVRGGGGRVRGKRVQGGGHVIWMEGERRGIRGEEKSLFVE